MKILALGAHPDDIEIFMYGLLSIFKKGGNEVYTMIATDGAKGGTFTGEKLAQDRANEAIAVKLSNGFALMLTFESIPVATILTLTRPSNLSSQVVP